MAAQVEIIMPFLEAGQKWSTWAGCDGMANQGWSFGVPGGTFAPLARPHQIATDTTLPGKFAIADGPAQMQAVDSFTLAERWHLNGAGAKTEGSSDQPGGPGNVITSVVLPNFSPNGGNVGGYREPNGTLDTWIVAVAYENEGATGVSSTVTDNIGGVYTRRGGGSVLVNNCASQRAGNPLHNVTLYLDVFIRTGQVVSPQNNVSITATFTSGVDNVQMLVGAFSGSPYPSSPFDADGPYTATGTVASGGNATPAVSPSTVSTAPLAFVIAAGLGGNSGITWANGIVSVGGVGATYDSNDFTDGGFGHSAPYWSVVIANASSGVADYIVNLAAYFTQVGGQASGGAINTNTFTAGASSPAGWIVYADALRK